MIQTSQIVTLRSTILCSVLQNTKLMDHQLKILKISLILLGIYTYKNKDNSGGKISLYFQVSNAVRKLFILKNCFLTELLINSKINQLNIMIFKIPLYFKITLNSHQGIRVTLFKMELLFFIKMKLKVSVAIMQPRPSLIKLSRMKNQQMTPIYRVLSSIYSKGNHIS